MVAFEQSSRQHRQKGGHMVSGFGVSGFLDEQKRGANNREYKGRFTCPNVQWTGTGRDLLGTFTVTAEELADAAESNMLWTDQDVQRGIQPGVTPAPARELSLAAGYPDNKLYIFDGENADNIVEKLLSGQKLFLSPLVWNLRPGKFEAFWAHQYQDLYLYSGKVYLPDSHHRQQAIIKAVTLWRSAQSEYPEFDGSRQFKVELYFLTRENEGDYFFDKNQRPKPTARSKAFDLTTQDDLSLLAKRVAELSHNLRGNVNRVTDRLIRKNAQVVTLSTLREMMNTFAASNFVDATEMEGLAKVAAQFYDLLATVRPELGILNVTERARSRDYLLVDSAVMMHGYAALMRDYNSDITRLGTSRAFTVWKEKLAYLNSDMRYQYGEWSGDFFDRDNPIWLQTGIMKPGRDIQRRTIVNTGASRIEAGRVLRQLLALDQRPNDLRFLARR